ncbi:MAG: tRNA (adenosine(37)-N6)-dimethylallyltransferase MiaA [Clostridiales bacterium]|nr:tRNA (adenosine(37)-N6)-dimethylallyltransferase MiaA [Clostridiales bacterium]
MEKSLVIIGGATATGKSDLAVRLAQKINGEIISADSMQIYKYMDIGTAKPTQAEQMGIKHYLIDELLPNEEYSVAVFKNMAKTALDEIYAKDKIPVVVGGTGFYINALLNDTDFTETQINTNYRHFLYDIALKYGSDKLHIKLREIDPQAADEIHENNIKRVIRALEYYYLTGEKISSHNKEQLAKQSPYLYKFFTLTLPRDVLYERINQRVDTMMEKGLEAEVRNLLNMGYYKTLTSMQGLGYKEIVEYIEGKISLDGAVSNLKQKTRNFAKRQITWFKNKTENIPINAADNNAVSEIISELERFFIY